MFAKLFRKKKPLTDINDAAAFFAELVSRSKNYLRCPVRIHFVADSIPGKTSCVSDIGDFLPFLRTVLFDAAQNTIPNPETSLHVYTQTEGSSKKILAAINAEAGTARTARHEFFIITLGKPSLQKEIIKEFSPLSPELRRRLTLFHLSPGPENSKAQTGALVSAARILLQGERIETSREGFRVL
jgi:hypothetical protein